MGNGALDQPLVYEVYYNGTMENVTSPTTELTFTAPSLPDGVFVDKITVTVTAINRFGHGTPSDPEEFKISRFFHMYHIYPNKSKAHINTWARINAEVQYSKVNK